MKNVLKDRRLGIMSVMHEGRKPFGMQTYFFEDMVKGMPQFEEELFFFSPLNWEKGVDQISGFKYVNQQWITCKESIPFLIYDRAFSRDNSQKETIEDVRSFLEKSNHQILNPLGLANLLNDKVKFHTFLQANHIPTLSSLPFSAIHTEEGYDAIRSERVYFKPIFGSKGEGIFVIERNENEFYLFDNNGNMESFDSYQSMIDSLMLQMDEGVHYFVQEAAKLELYDTSPFDIRVLVQNYGDAYVVTGKAVRVGQKQSITSNLNAGGNALPLEELADFFEEKYNYSIESLQSEIDQLCLDCAEVIKNEVGEFCEIGFDVLLTTDYGPVILEGNAKPSRWVFVKMADYLESIGKDNTYYLERRKETVSVPVKYARFLGK